MGKKNKQTRFLSLSLSMIQSALKIQQQKIIKTKQKE